MKKFVLTMALLVSASNAVAAPTCFNFVNGHGPQQVGNFAFGGTAERICLSSENVRLSDSQGDLAIVGSTITASGRCAGVCHQFTLNYGNINGENVDLSGTTIEVQAEQDQYLGMLKGLITIQVGRGFAEKFLIMEAK